MTTSCRLILNDPKVDGRPVGSESNSPRDVLREELEMFVRGRLLLIVTGLRDSIVPIHGFAQVSIPPKYWYPTTSCRNIASHWLL